MAVFSVAIKNKKTGQSDPNELRMVGALLPVEIEVPPPMAEHLGAAGDPIPTPVTGRGLIDTGASVTVVDQSVIDQLGIAPVGVATVAGVTGQEKRQLHPARLTLPGTPLPPVDFAAVTGASLDDLGIIALIGRDLLRHMLLIYDGTSGVVTLSI